MSQTSDPFKAKALAVLIGGGVAAILAGLWIADATYVPVWLVVAAFLVVALMGTLSYRREGVAAQKLAAAQKQAEEEALAQRQAEERQRLAQEEAGLKQAQGTRTLNRAVDQLLDFAEDLGAGASKDRLVSAMSESVARIEAQRAYLDLPESRRAKDDLALVLSKLDAAQLSDTVTATRIRRMLDGSPTQ